MAKTNPGVVRIRSENISVNCALIKEKASYLAKELNAEILQASEGWLDK